MPKKNIGFAQKEESSSCTPPKIFSRNEHGLIDDDSIKYLFTGEGLIDWRKMVKQEYLVPNRQKTSTIDVTKLEDKDLRTSYPLAPQSE